MAAVPIGPAALARKVAPAGPSRPHICNVLAGRAKFSPAAAANVRRELRKASAERQHSDLVKSFGVLALRAFTGGAR